MTLIIDRLVKYQVRIRRMISQRIVAIRPPIMARRNWTLMRGISR